MLALLIGGTAAAGTYYYAKNKKKASTGQSAIAAAATGAAGWGVAWLALTLFWPLLIIGGAVGAGYYIGKKKEPKALPPAS